MLEEEDDAMLATSALYKRDLVLKLRKVPLAARLLIAVKSWCCCTLVPVPFTLDLCTVDPDAQPTEAARMCQRHKRCSPRMIPCITSPGWISRVLEHFGPLHLEGLPAVVLKRQCKASLESVVSATHHDKLPLEKEDDGLFVHGRTAVSTDMSQLSKPLSI